MKPDRVEHSVSWRSIDKNGHVVASHKAILRGYPNMDLALRAACDCVYEVTCNARLGKPSRVTFLRLISKGTKKHVTTEVYILGRMLPQFESDPACLRSIKPIDYFVFGPQAEKMVQADAAADKALTDMKS